MVPDFDMRAPYPPQKRKKYVLLASLHNSQIPKLVFSYTPDFP